MKKTRTRENDAVFFMLLGLTAVFFCWRCRYGFAEADEAFYPTIAYRLTQGDRLLVDEWHMSQLSSVLLYLPVLLFTRLTGGTAGIYLALRYLYVAVQCLVAATVYLRLRRYHSLGAAAGALALAVYAPYGINALSYNSLGILLMAMTGALLVPAEEESRAAYILAGLSFAGSVLCCPYLIAVYLLYALFVFIPRKKKKLPAFYPRPFGLFTLGAAGLAIVFFFVGLAGADLSRLDEILKGIFSDPAHPERTSLLKSVCQAVMDYPRLVFYHGYWRPGACMVLVLLMIPAALLDKHRERHAPAYFLIGTILTIAADDPKGHKRSFLKIIDGSLRLRDVVRINDSEKFIKIKNLKTIYQGREINVDEVGANDIAIVEDIEDFRIGDYLGAKPCLIQGLSHQHPALKSSVRPNKPEERSKVISALNTLWIEDPSLSFSINSYSDELEISLYGLTQKEIIQTLLEERFSVKVHFDEIKTIYKERPIKKVNKIIQIEVPPNPYWATIGLTLEPLPLGAGLQIESDISYGYLNHSFQNAVFEGIRMSCQSGLHGWEVTDLKVTFTQAEYYSPVSTPADFRQLTPYVFRLALQQSGVDILEPMLCFELQIPQVASSKAITDLQKLMSEIEDISCNNEWCHIKGKVPLNTSKDYASEVSSYTKGLGIFMVKPCGYQITKDGYSDNIRMNEKDKLLFMFQKSIYELIQNKKKI